MMEQIIQQLQEADNAASNFNRELLAAGPKMEGATAMQKQDILARLRADRDTVSRIITETIATFNKYAFGLLRGADMALADFEKKKGSINHE